MIERICHLGWTLLAVGALLAPAAAATESPADLSDLKARYVEALAATILQNWLRPDLLPDQPCVIHIVQIPGGDVLSVKADPSCPYDATGKRSVENAVLRAQPLPYKGYERVFQRQLDFTFRPQ
jgi:colicin import membrane protein